MERASPLSRVGNIANQRGKPKRCDEATTWQVTLPRGRRGQGGAGISDTPDGRFKDQMKPSAELTYEKIVLPRRVRTSRVRMAAIWMLPTRPMVTTAHQETSVPSSHEPRANSSSHCSCCSTAIFLSMSWCLIGISAGQSSLNGHIRSEITPPPKKNVV